LLAGCSEDEANIADMLSMSIPLESEIFFTS